MARTRALVTLKMGCGHHLPRDQSRQPVNCRHRGQSALRDRRLRQYFRAMPLLCPRARMFPPRIHCPQSLSNARGPGRSAEVVVPAGRRQRMDGWVNAILLPRWGCGGATFCACFSSWTGHAVDGHTRAEAITRVKPSIFRVTLHRE